MKTSSSAMMTPRGREEHVEEPKKNGMGIQRD